MSTVKADLVKWFAAHKESGKYLSPMYLHHVTGIDQRDLSWALWNLFDTGVIERVRKYSPYTQKVCWCYRLKG